MSTNELVLVFGAMKYLWQPPSLLKHCLNLVDNMMLVPAQCCKHQSDAEIDSTSIPALLRQHC